MKSADEFFTSMPVLSILFILFSVLVSNAVKMHNNSNDFTERLNASLFVIGMTQTMTILLNVGVNMKNIMALFQTIQTIVDDECKIVF